MAVDDLGDYDSDLNDSDPNDSDPNEDGLDLTPRARDAEKRGSRVLPGIVIAAVLCVIAFVLFQGLSGATLFVRTADTAVEERDTLSDSRFRLTGSPIAVSEEEFEFENNTAVRFSIACDGTAVDVIHIGNVAESFQLGVPVVLEGRWTNGTDLDVTWDRGANDGYYFESDRMLVEHDNEYREDRVEQAASCGDETPDAPETAQGS